MSNHKLREIQVEETNSQKSLAVRETSVQFSGPLPHPDILLAYNQIDPSFADRIVKMAETQSEHRKALEKKVIGSDALRASLGLWFALIIVLTSVASGVYLAMNDKVAAAIVIPATALTSIVGAFIYQKRESVGKHKGVSSGVKPDTVTESE